MNPRDITAMVLAGGRGTRLRPVVKDRPKPLALVGGRPFLSLILANLGRAGLRRAILCLGYRAGQIKDELGNSQAGVSLDYSVEDTPLGTGGALRRALPRLSTPWALVLNGDSLCEFDLAGMLASHQRSGLPLTILRAWVEDAARYGKLEMDEKGGVTGFAEKGCPGPNWINAGVYLVARNLIAQIPPQGQVSLEAEIMPAWLARGAGSYPAQGGFIDIGTPESFSQAQVMFSPTPVAEPQSTADPR